MRVGVIRSSARAGRRVFGQRASSAWGPAAGAAAHRACLHIWQVQKAVHHLVSIIVLVPGNNKESRLSLKWQSWGVARDGGGPSAERVGGGGEQAPPRLRACLQAATALASLLSSCTKNFIDSERSTKRSPAHVQQGGRPSRLAHVLQQAVAHRMRRLPLACGRRTGGRLRRPVGQRVACYHGRGRGIHSLRAAANPVPAGTSSAHRRQ